MATIESRVTALERQHGGDEYKLVKLVGCADGETANEARARAGLADWPGEIIFLTGADTKL
ncbi:MAG: hypothetical protein Q8R84_09825 [Candidatus Nitrotoga sp.]|nr:hypothetical protein [Candidatus Nitrotoga sp.]